MPHFKDVHCCLRHIILFTRYLCMLDVGGLQFSTRRARVNVQWGNMQFFLCLNLNLWKKSAAWCSCVVSIMPFRLSFHCSLVLCFPICKTPTYSAFYCCPTQLQYFLPAQKVITWVKSTEIVLDISKIGSPYDNQTVSDNICSTRCKMRVWHAARLLGKKRLFE